MEILLTGNLGAFSPSSYHELAVNHKIIAAGRDVMLGEPKSPIKGFSHAPQDELFPEAFRLYDLGAVVFFASRGEQQNNGQAGSLESLSAVLALCDRHKIGRFVYVSSMEVYGQGDSAASGGSEPHSLNQLLMESGEKMVAHYSRQPGRQAHILRIPYLYGEANKDSLLGQITMQAANKQPVKIPGAAGQACDFLYVNDFVSLLGRVIDHEATGRLVTVNAGGGKALTFGDVAKLVEKRFPGCAIVYSTDPASVPAPAASADARQLYDWVALREFENDFPAVVESLIKTRQPRPTVLSRIKNVLVSRKWIIQILEILLSFLLMEFLITLTGDSLQFRFIDIRLLFVVIIGIIHGIRAGVIAALLACLSIIFAYVSMHVDWRAVVYNVNSWLPFVSYLLAGAVTGYLRDKNDSALEFARQKSEAQEKHYSFLYDLYNQTLGHKDQYKSQLISYRDSFGRVYEVTRRLDRLVPDAIFQQAVQILEDTIGSTSIAIYTVDGAGAFARLAVSSAGLADKLGRSISISEYAELFSNLQKDQVWVNRQLLEKYPFFGVPVYNSDALVAVVMAYEVPYDQKSSAGANQFQVISGLIQAALVRAIAYNEATEAQANVAGTHIIVQEKFAELLAIRREMQRMKLAEYSLLRVEEPAGDLVWLSGQIEQAIRRTDFMGQGVDGSIYLLLAQAQASAESPVVRRLESLGIHCAVVETPAAAENSMEVSGDVA